MISRTNQVLGVAAAGWDGAAREGERRLTAVASRSDRLALRSGSPHGDASAHAVPIPAAMSSVLPFKHTTSRAASSPEIETVTERKFVTVLFVDVKGSMSLSSAIELEEWWSVIADLFELMCESVYRFDGWVASFTGDGINAVFEPCGAADHHALRACDAALWLRDAICAPAADLWREHGLDLAVRVGINSGEVLTGTIGERYRRDYTVGGYAVALAKRIEALALPGRIYLSEHTAALVAGAVALRDLGAFDVKGADTPVGVFELVGSDTRAVPAHAAAHRGFRRRPDWLKRRGTTTRRSSPRWVGRDPTPRIAANSGRHERPGSYGITRVDPMTLGR